MQGGYLNTKKLYYVRLREFRNEIASSKQSIIDEISLLEYSSESSVKIKELSAKYMSLGFCGKDVDNNLFNSFKAAKSEYYNRGTVMHKDNASKKEYILAQLSEISSQERMYKFKDRLSLLEEEWIDNSDNKIQECWDAIREYEDKIAEYRSKMS